MVNKNKERKMCAWEEELREAKFVLVNNGYWNRKVFEGCEE